MGKKDLKSLWEDKMAEEHNKNKNWLWVGIVVIVIIVLAFVLIINSQNSNAPPRTNVNYNLIKENDKNNLLSFVYNCNTSAITKEVACEGIVNYAGPNDRWVEADIGLYCYKENPDDTSGKCTVGSDSFNLGHMDNNRNQIPFQLKCSYGYENNFNVTIGFNGIPGVLPQDCYSQGL